MQIFINITQQDILDNEDYWFGWPHGFVLHQVLDEILSDVDICVQRDRLEITKDGRLRCFPFPLAAAKKIQHNILAGKWTPFAFTLEIDDDLMYAPTCS
jgi:hypothetical protein